MQRKSIIHLEGIRKSYFMGKNELEVLKELIERKRKQTKYKDDLKLMQYLTRQGFSYDHIKTALNK